MPQVWQAKGFTSKCTAMCLLTSDGDWQVFGQHGQPQLKWPKLIGSNWKINQRFGITL